MTEQHLVIFWLRCGQAQSPNDRARLIGDIAALMAALYDARE
ncbi:MAG: hypothetical protein ACRD82_17450 [Blastocatellia bacterium]